MAYNPEIHHRRSIRLKNYDYSSPGMYFITICTETDYIFGRINHGNMILTPFGQIAHDQWLAIPQRFPHILLDEFIIMPNHIHGILQIIVRAPLAGALIPNKSLIPNDPLHNDIKKHDRDQSSEKYLSDYQLDGCNVRDGATARVAPTIGHVMGAYKSLCVHECLKWAKTHDVRYRIGPLWQRNYYECVIRNERALFKIREYIRNNPLKWEKDRLWSVGKNLF